MTSSWTRVEGGYAKGTARILDNGCGVGPSKGSGRWAVEVDGRWIANVDTLAEAKARAEGPSCTLCLDRPWELSNGVVDNGSSVVCPRCGRSNAELPPVHFGSWSMVSAAAARPILST